MQHPVGLDQILICLPPSLIFEHPSTCCIIHAIIYGSSITACRLSICPAYRTQLPEIENKQKICSLCQILNFQVLYYKWNFTASHRMNNGSLATLVIGNMCFVKAHDALNAKNRLFGGISGGTCSFGRYYSTYFTFQRGETMSSMGIKLYLLSNFLCSFSLLLYMCGNPLSVHWW